LSKRSVLFILFFLFACGGDPKPSPTPTPEVPPLEIAARSAEVMLAVQTLHFNIERDGALVYIDDSQLLAFKRAEGDFVVPDEMRATVRIITAFTPVSLGMIVLGDEQYATDPITGRWGVLPEEWGQFNLAVLFHPETGLQGLLEDGIAGLELLGVEKVGERPCYHLSGEVKGERMSSATLGFIGEGDVAVEVWVDSEDFYMRRLIIVEPYTDPNEPTTWDLGFSQFGQEVEIQAPPLEGDD
jgi:lipoprotein LprG